MLAKDIIRSYSKRVEGPVGFIGLGKMGNHMAKNLLKAGHRLFVYDSRKSAMSEFPKFVNSIGEMSKICNRIITMLPNGKDVKSVYLDSDLINVASPGTTFIDCSTIEPDLEIEISTIANGKSINFLDAPVSGGVKAAEDGTLTFMAGGDNQIIQQNMDLFLSMGKAIFHCGPIGSGQIAKICNNLILGISMIGLSEALNLGINMGLCPKKLSSIINASSGRSWASELYNPHPGVIESSPSSSDYSCGFGVKLMAKDMKLAQSAALKNNIPLPVGGVVSELYQKLSETPTFEEKDFSVIYRWLSSNH